MTIVRQAPFVAVASAPEADRRARPMARFGSPKPFARRRPRGPNNQGRNAPVASTLRRRDRLRLQPVPIGQSSALLTQHDVHTHCAAHRRPPRPRQTATPDRSADGTPGSRTRIHPRQTFPRGARAMPTTRCCRASAKNRRARSRSQCQSVRTACGRSAESIRRGRAIRRRSCRAARRNVPRSQQAAGRRTGGTTSDNHDVPIFQNGASLLHNVAIWSFVHLVIWSLKLVN